MAGPEAVMYLELYLDMRRKGTRYSPPEQITDESPLIRDESTTKTKGIQSKQIRNIVHNLYKKAGLLKKGLGTPLRPARTQHPKILQNPNDSIRRSTRLR